MLCQDIIFTSFGILLIFVTVAGSCGVPPTVTDATYLPVKSDYADGEGVTYTCDTGYTQDSGDLTLTCDNSTGNWDGTPLSCKLVTCAEEVVSYSSKLPDQSTYDFNTTVVYTCEPGYEHSSGNLSITCMDSGSWSGPAPVCTIVTCAEPADVPNSSKIPNQTSYDYNTNIAYTCGEGFERTSGDLTRTCTASSTWSGVAPICTVITCAEENIPNSSKLPDLTSYAYNATVDFTCVTGHEHTSGDLERTCTGIDTWSGSAPVCSIVTCGAVTVSDSSKLPDQASHDYNTDITYTCNTGYEHTSGNLTRTCTANGTWSGYEPVCTIVTCAAEDAPYASKSPNQTEYDYNTIVVYTCEVGYDHTSGNLSRTCTASRAWTGIAPTCTLVTCAEEVVGHSSKTPDQAIYNYSAIVEYVCDTGYESTGGALSRMCTASGTWTGTSPVCSIKTCAKVNVDHASADPDQTDYDYNTDVTYSCDLAYNHTAGNLTRTCNASAEWTGTLPTCERAACIEENGTHVTFSPSTATTLHNFGDVITYSCELGYNVSTGDETRTCQSGTGQWTGTALTCTIVTCDLPTPADHATVTPNDAEHDYDTSITYTCDLSYNHTSGNLVRTCQADGQWSEDAPVCTVVACIQEGTDNSTFSPDSPSTLHNFGDVLTYTCDIGYNYSTGDLVRTCQAGTGQWTGELPTCLIITCDPPAAIDHTMYTPVLTEHDWNTDIHYTCHSDYHYVSGIDITTCNETGNFPPVDFDCSVEHTLSIDPGEPAVTIINPTVPTANIKFNFDGMCNMAVAVVPDGLDASLSSSGTVITVTVSERADSVWNIYSIDLLPTRLGRSWSTVSATVFYGLEIQGLQAWLDNPIIYIAVGDYYTYRANGTQGTNVSVAWTFEAAVLVNNSYPGEFNTASVSYRYNSPGEYNISVIASNLVNSQTVYVYVIAIYYINNLAFNVDSFLGNTTENSNFEFRFGSTANLPMDIINFNVNYKYGTNDSETHDLSPSVSLPYVISLSHLFPVQGIYLVEARAENILGNENFTINMSIWDTLDPLEFNFYQSNGKYITNTTTTLIFENVPNAGFEYIIDYGDGFSESSNSSDILYQLYDLTEFNHTYTLAGVYTIRWIASNGHYRRDERFTVLIQNKVPSEGYSLEPIDKKYPWINLQSIKIPVNITLNDTVPLPTNATCVFEPDDGKPQVLDLVYNESFFQHKHQYLLEGNFSSSLNCSNEVSWYVYTFSLCVQKYNASFLSLVFESLVPLNVSDTVIVYFHIDNGGFELIPERVTLDFDFGEATSRWRRSPVTYDQPTYDHLYSERGNYTVTVVVRAIITDTTSTLVYPLRLGIMYFKYNYDIGFINTTEILYEMYGVLGTDTTYTIDFADSTPYGQCSSVDISGCEVPHIFPYWGERTVQVVARNSTFVEVDEVFMTIDNPIVNFTLDIVRTVAIPNGTVDVNFRIEEDSPVLPFLNCNVSMGDPISRDMIIDTQNVTYPSPFYYSFQYIALGRHKIEAYCWNLINETSIWTEIVVTNKDFLFTGTFDRQFSQRLTPLRLSAMKDNEITNRLFVLAPLEEKTRINEWMVENTYDIFPGRHSIIFPRAYLNDGTYLVILTVGFVEEPGNKIGEPTYLDFISPPPHAEVVGGRRRITSEGTVIFDAETLSYDQVFPQNSGLIFSWDCKSYTGLVTFDDVIAAHEAGGSSQSCTTTPASPGNVTVNTVSSRWYAVTVTVENNRTLTSSYTQYVQIKSTMDLRIICKINCLAKIAVTSNLQLVPQLSNNGPASFKWRLQKESGSSYGSYINLETITETGSTSQSLTVKSNNLDPGSWYLVTLDMTQEGTIYGPAYYEFVTNKPPKGGSCQVVPYDQYKIPITSGTYSQTANLREYNLTCKDWLDEGFTDDTWTEDEPLYYLFFLQYGEDVIQRQILYFDPGATSNLVTFQIGNIEDSYKATAVLQISDVFGDYIELRYDVVSEPYLTTEQMLPLSPTQQLNTISNNISQFDDELLKANQSYDYRTLARKIQGIASVYNAVVLNTSTSISLTPDDLLTLGYKKTDDGKLIKWADYWQMIVEVVDTSTQDFLILTGEKYVLMLHHSIVTWPTNRRISIVAIETMSRALNATLSVIDYSNVTAAIKAAECADELSKHLGYHVEDRTFPNTDDIMYAATALRDLIRNCLATLQAVLTPNLPVDPTVEEMRNYLLYIQVFRTEVDGSAPLSLQEQTFLAQKQLQKYHVQKYIKSEASKQALPHLMNSLTHLAEMFSKMIQIGQQEMFLENDFIYVSAEIIPAYLLFGTTVVRPHAAIVLDSLIETHPEAYNGSAVTIKTTIFKHNPYFWGEWADRISSYVPKFELEKAILIGDIIRFKLQNAVTPDCIDATPTYFEDDPNKMIYMLFDRMYGDDDILLFIRPNATELVYQAYFNKDEKPSIEDGQYIYSTEIKTDKWTHEDGYKIKINAEDFSTTGKIWIALRPLLENSGDLSLLTKPFCANITSVNCLAWVPDSEGNYYWDRQLCKVSRESTRAETICECQNPGTALTVGTTFYVPPNKIDFKAVFVDTDPLGNTPVLGTIIAVISGFVLFVFWAWRADLKDKYKWSYALLVDNDIADSYFYLIRVYTGIRHGSGTKSNVGFVLVGDDGDTGIRIMDDDSHVGFEAGSVRNFVLSTRQLLGDIVCLRIWHDDTGGNDSAWFLNRIGVTDLQTGKKYVFKCNEWLDYDRGDRRVDRVLTAQTADDHRTLYEMAPYTAAENHLWMSVFVRPLNSNFTRVQRMACLLGLMYLAMIVSTLILKTPDEVPGMEQVVVGPFRFSMENFLTAFISVAVASPIIMIVAFLFKNSESAEDDNEYLSCCRKGYKGVNDFLKIDKSVLGTEYIPPTRVVVRHFHFLPHFCVFVGWALLLLIVAMATWLLVLFSMDWKQEKSEVWMTTMFTAVLLSIFVVETIKVGLIIAVVALLCNKAYDPPEPYIDVDKLKEITKKNSHFLTKGPFYTNYLHQPPLPDHETLEDNRRKRISNHQLLKIFYQLVAFGGVLYIAYMISFESRDPQSYFFKRHVEDMMAFDTVKDMDTYISWLNGTFVEQFFFSKYFGAEYHEGTYKSFTTDIANVRVGPARLRQLRISREDCAGPLGVGLDCYNKYVDSKVETTDHCIAWKKMPCAVSEKADYFSSPAWLYNSSDEVWGFPTMAEYTTYGGGGYFMKLDVNKEVSLKIFSELVRQGWIDRQTRVVILEFTLYNLNANLFAYAKFVAEFPEVGGVIPYTDIQIFRLYTNSSTILFLQFFFVLLVLAATVYMLYEICSNGIIFLKQIWNWLDILALVMSYTTIGVFILKLGILERTIDVFHKDKNAYVSFENLAFYDFVANTTHGILVFLLSIRVSRILGYSGKINEMAAVITSSAGDLAGFLIIFGVTYFAYVELGTLLFGKGTSKYRDMFHTYGTLTEAIVGKNRLAVILTTQPMLAEFYYFTFVLFVLLTLATMAAAILNFSISHVKKESEQISAPNIIEVVFDKIGAFIKRLTDDSNKDNTGSKKNRGRRKSSTSELRDILTDFKYFLRDVKLESKEKYRVLTPEPDPDPKGFLKRGTS